MQTETVIHLHSQGLSRAEVSQAVLQGPTAGTPPRSKTSPTSQQGAAVGQPGLLQAEPGCRGEAQHGT